MKTLALLFSSILLTGTVFASGVIDIAYSPYTISKPGSYIVVKDLTTAQNLNCFIVNTSDVTIDLNGHTIYGPGQNGSGGSGIYSAAGNNITITNGTFSNFNGYGIDLPVAQAHISKVKIVGCNTGIRVDGGLIENNLVTENGDYGIVCGNAFYPAVIMNNVVSNNDNLEGGIFDFPAIFVTTNCDIIGNNVTGNLADGIYVTNNNCKITGNTVINNTGYDGAIYVTGNTCIITGNNVNSNSGVGGIMVGGNNCTITGNNVANNSAYGIYAGYGCNIIGNTVDSNSTGGIFVNNGCRVSDNEVYSNLSSGIAVNNGCTLTDNNVYSNSSDGIDMISGSLVRGNTIRSNGHYGISGDAGNRIEGNVLDVNNSVGIYVNGSANSILSNSVTSDDTGLWISSGHNFFAGNVFNNNSVSTTIAANNTAGNGTTGFVNTVF